MRQKSHLRPPVTGNITANRYDNILTFPISEYIRQITHSRNDLGNPFTHHTRSRGLGLARNEPILQVGKPRNKYTAHVLSAIWLRRDPNWAPNWALGLDWAIEVASH